MKRKLNWVDYTVIVLLVALIAAVCFFFFGRGATDEATVKQYEVVLDSNRCDKGQHDSLYAGEIFKVFNGGAFGTLLSEPEIVPYKSVVFNEQTKQYDVSYSEDLCHYRMTFRVEGTLDQYNQLNVGGTLMIIDEPFVIESAQHRISTLVRSVKEVVQ